MWRLGLAVLLLMGMGNGVLQAQNLSRAWNRTKGIPGAAYVLVQQDSVVETGGFGRTKMGGSDTIDGSTVFRAGSLGKVVVALGIFRLVDRDQLELDDQVKNLLPGISLENPWEATDPVTVLHLLEHSSGMGDMHFNEYYVDQPLPLEKAFLRNTAARTVRWRPGTTPSYSNVGYALLALLGERISGQGWQDWLKATVLIPLGMDDTGFGQLPKSSNQAQGHQANSALTVNPFYLYPPSLSFYSTAADLGKLLSCMAIEDTSFLSSPSWYRLSANESSLAGKAGIREGYGAGLQTHHFEGWPFHYHTGKVDGYSSILEFSPELQTGFAVLYNTNPEESLLNSPLVASCRLRGMNRRRNLDDRPVEVLPLTDTLKGGEGFYYFANPRNDLLAPLDQIRLGVQVTKTGSWWKVGKDSYYELGGGRLGKRKTIHCGAVLGRDSVGEWFLQKGKYFYKKGNPLWRDLFRIGFWLYLSCSALLLFGEMLRWVRGRRGGASWLYTVPLLAGGGYALVKAADFATLGTFNLSTLVIFMVSWLVPLLTIGLAVRWYQKRSGQPLLLQGLAGLVALGNVGLVAFMGWAGWIGLALWNW